jgi:hypothetical protein
MYHNKQPPQINGLLDGLLLLWVRVANNVVGSFVRMVDRSPAEML